jgi:ubiquinone/menaquinone biosynthesis C-methylase UbiE
VQRAARDGLSAGWEKCDAVILDQPGSLSTAMVERREITDAHRPLDIASGTGEPGLSVAGVAPRGHVVLIALSAETLAVAARRADERTRRGRHPRVQRGRSAVR